MWTSSNVCQIQHSVSCAWISSNFFIKSNSMYPVIRLLAMFVKSNLVSPRAWISSNGYQIQHCVLIIFQSLPIKHENWESYKVQDDLVQLLKKFILVGHSRTSIRKFVMYMEVDPIFKPNCLTEISSQGSFNPSFGFALPAAWWLLIFFISIQASFRQIFGTDTQFHHERVPKFRSLFIRSN